MPAIIIALTDTKFKKLEKLSINYGNVENNLVSKNNKKIYDFKNFENTPNLNYLEIDIETNYKNGIKFGNFGSKSKIKELKIAFIIFSILFLILIIYLIKLNLLHFRIHLLILGFYHQNNI